jgi:tetrameric-type glycyl-tRNA synthetase alpha subunit
MQDALLALTKYWTDRGCMVVQPFNTEVGAGTLNPATILRVLGPEPWRVAYVEPSVRPDDSRYGENPNRLQTHTQFQVVLKPDPGNPQELFLDSLSALGIDIDAHDVRFVEDNWANPATGSWGLGWEVWLDGLEITQFTYFQQAGGMTLDPVSVEITYGIERIMMALQGVSHFKDIAYAPGISYGEAFGQAEYEMSRYYLDDADVESQKRLFEEYANEARRMLDAHPGAAVLAHVQRPRRPRRRQYDGTRQGVRPDADPGSRGLAAVGRAPRGAEAPVGSRRTAAGRGAADRVPQDHRNPAVDLRDRHRGDAAVRGHQDRCGGAGCAGGEAGRDAARARRNHDVRDPAPGSRLRRVRPGR